VRSGLFSRGDPSLFEPLLQSVLGYDPFFVIADFAAYRDCQNVVSETYGDRDRWLAMSIANTAHTGKFSSDRTIRSYCNDIWRVSPVAIHRGIEPRALESP
jgi:starch phosphorylase